MVNYKEAKSKIFENKVKSWGVFIGVGILAGIGFITGYVDAGVKKAKKYCEDVSESYNDEAQQIKAEAEAQKAKENNQWKEDLKKVEETDKDVRGGDSDFCLIM